MLSSFFDSVLQLVIRTSTDLPPDVRAAMKAALDAETAGTQASQALSIIAQNIDLAVDGEGAICQDTGMLDVRGEGAGRRQPDLAARADPRGGRRGDAPRQAAPQLRRLDHREELRGQPRPGDAGHPLRAVGAGRDRGQADSQGRRLREHQRAVRASPWICRISAAPIARSTASGNASFTPSGRRKARGAVRARSASASAAIARPGMPTRKRSCSARSTM